MMKPSLVLLLAFSLALATSVAAKLQKDFYKKSCPQAEQTVQTIIWKHVAGNPELAAKFLRLFFHDCFVRGCDASILIDSKAKDTEKFAAPNLSLAGFDVIEDVKNELEKECPGVVSCADIIALAARDSVSYQFHRSLWEVKLGRRDGKISRSSEARTEIPSPNDDFSTLVGRFAKKSLDVKDLVVLSGGHTIGVGHCNLFSQRLYNFTGKNQSNDTDPALDPAYAAFLKTKCKALTDNVTTVPMDPGSSTDFDNHYFVNLQQNQGMFLSDATLLTDGRSARLVDKLAGGGDGGFFSAFKNSIAKMGDIDVLTGTQGEIRKTCSKVNS